MSASNIKSYFVTRFKALDLNHWDNPRFDNIPENKMNAFHIEMGDFTTSKTDQQSIEVQCPVTVRAFIKGSRSKSAIDSALEILDSAIDEVMISTNRLNITGVKTISLRSSNVGQISETNDKDAKLEMSFQALLIYGT